MAKPSLSERCVSARNQNGEAVSLELHAIVSIVKQYTKN
jgi:hypothetical protein